MNLNNNVHARLKIYGTRELLQYEGSVSGALIWALEQLRRARTSHNHAGHQPIQLALGGTPEECESFFNDELRQADALADSLQAKLDEAEAKGEIPAALSMLDGAIQAHNIKGPNWNYEPYGLTLEQVRSAGLPDYCAAGNQETRPVKPYA